MLALTCACAGSLALVAGPVTPVAAAPAANNCTQISPSVAANDWPRQMLAPDRAWSFTRGGGRVVAVLDSGVDADQPQLRNHVMAGYDAVKGSGPANTDCTGTGTAVAGAIVAQAAGNGIAGVAPNAQVMPVRITGEPGDDGTKPVSPSVLARGIAWAVQHHAAVLDISVALTVDDPQVRAAVADAITAGVVVVAAVGDSGAADAGNPTPYPASYPNVIGVGAIGPTGTAWSDTGHGGFVDLVAPGASVVALQRVQGLVLVQGSTALAAGYVSGVAALALNRWPSAGRAAVTARLIGTSIPAASQGGSYGHGIVNPYGAVSDDMVARAPVPLPKFSPSSPSRQELARRAAWNRGRHEAVLLTVIGLGVALVVTVVAIGVPRARRRAWRPAYAAPVVNRPEPMEPGPPALLFEEPSSDFAPPGR